MSGTTGRDRSRGRGIVIVGGGLAAARIVRAYRAAGGDDTVTVLASETTPPYHRPPLSKGFLRGEIEANAVLVEPEGAFEALDVDLRLGCAARRVDLDARAVTLADGGTLSYDRIVLASGSLPRPLGIPGEELQGVHTFRTIADAAAVSDAVGSARRALVIGGGFIGMETTASLRRRGLEVTQIDRASSLFASLGAPPLSRSLEELYRERGVEVLLDNAVERFRGAGGRLTGAVTRSGRELEVELAIVGVGVQPSTAYLDGSRLELDRGAVVIDRSFAASRPGVFAAGDVATFPDPISGRRRPNQHWTNANHQGERLGRCLAGEDAPHTLVATFFSEVFGKKLGLLGDPEGHDQLVMRGSLEADRLLGCYLRGGRLVAALVSGQTAETQAVLESLLRRSAELRDRAALADADVPIEMAFAAIG